MTQEIPLPRRTLIFGTAVVSDIIILDQLSKWFMSQIQHQPLIGDWLSFTYAENTGIAFSLPLEGLAQQIITVALIAALIGIVVRYKTWNRQWLHYSLMLILGGALGNAIDRLFRGYVIDFIHVGSFPIFNIADTGVTLGVIGVLMYEMWLKPRFNAQQTMSPQFPHQP